VKHSLDSASFCVYLGLAFTSWLLAEIAVGHKLVVQAARESPLFFFILLTMLADQSPFYSIFYQMIKWPFLSFW